MTRRARRTRPAARHRLSTTRPATPGCDVLPLTLRRRLLRLASYEQVTPTGSWRTRWRRAVVFARHAADREKSCGKGEVKHDS